jgi:hypothetical protein
MASKQSALVIEDDKGGNLIFLLKNFSITSLRNTIIFDIKHHF